MPTNIIIAFILHVMTVVVVTGYYGNKIIGVWEIIIQTIDN